MQAGDPMPEAEGSTPWIGNSNPGAVPPGWTVNTLNDIVGFSRKPRDLRIPPDGIPFIPMEFIPEGGTTKPGWEIRTEDEIRSGTYCEKGDILLPKITPSFENGKQAIVVEIPSDFAYATTEVFSFHPSSNKVEDDFLFFYFLAPAVRAELAGKMEGSTGRQRIPKAVIENQQVLLPPLPEQRAITHALRTVRQAIEATGVVIAAARELKRSLLEHLFTYGPVPVEQAEMVGHQETEIGIIPHGWDVIPMSEVAEINPESRDPSSETPEENFEYVDISSVEGGTGRILRTNPILGKDAPSRARRVVRERDVILSTVRPYLQSFAIVPPALDGAICSTGFAVLRSSEETLPEYLLYSVFSQHVGEQFERRMKGASYPAVNVGDVKETLVPLPPKQSQVDIANILSALDAKLFAEVARKDALDALFSTLLSHLMTGKVRVPGRVVPSNEEKLGLEVFQYDNRS